MSLNNCNRFVHILYINIIIFFPLMINYEFTYMTNLILFQERERARMLQCVVLPWRSASSSGPSTKQSYLHGNIDSPLSWMAGVVFTIHQSFSARFTVTMTCTGTHGSLTHHLYVYVSVFINYNVCESDWFL